MGLNYRDYKKITKGIDGKLLGLLLPYWEIVATSIFQYEYDDIGIDDLDRHIERYLYATGSVVFFKDKKTGVYGVLPYAFQGGLNWYGELVNWRVIGANGYNEDYNIDNSVMIRANKLMMSNFAYVYSQVKRLVNIDNAIDVNINQLKVPTIFSGDENSLLTMKNVYKKMVENEPVIYIDKEFRGQGKEFKGIPTNNSYYGTELADMYNIIEGRILKVFGLKYLNTDKKERLVVDEANSNDDYINTFLWDSLNERQKACEKIKRIFGININVKINPLLMPERKEESNDKELEGDEDIEE